MTPKEKWETDPWGYISYIIILFLVILGGGVVMEWFFKLFPPIK